MIDRIVMTAIMSDRFDELITDKKAGDLILMRAMASATNQLASILKGEKALWDEVLEAAGVDPQDGPWTSYWDYKERRWIAIRVKEEKKT